MGSLYTNAPGGNGLNDGLGPLSPRSLHQNGDEGTGVNGMCLSTKREEGKIPMYIVCESAACLILAALVVTLLFAGCALLITLDEGAALLGHLARRIASNARIFVARRTSWFPKRIVSRGVVSQAKWA